MTTDLWNVDDSTLDEAWSSVVRRGERLRKRRRQALTGVLIALVALPLGVGIARAWQGSPSVTVAAEDRDAVAEPATTSTLLRTTPAPTRDFRGRPLASLLAGTGATTTGRTDRSTAIVLPSGSIVTLHTELTSDDQFLALHVALRTLIWCEPNCGSSLVTAVPGRLEYGTSPIRTFERGDGIAVEERADGMTGPAIVWYVDDEWTIEAATRDMPSESRAVFASKLTIEMSGPWLQFKDNASIKSKTISPGTGTPQIELYSATINLLVRPMDCAASATAAPQALGTAKTAIATRCVPNANLGYMLQGSLDEVQSWWQATDVTAER